MYKIVIIDNEMLVREDLKRIFKWNELGCEIVGEADSGYDGVALIRNKKPDIVITDIMIDAINGLDMLKKVSESVSNIKLIILSGYREFEYAQEAIRLGVLAYLLKPINADELRSCMEKTVNLIKNEQAYFARAEKPSFAEFTSTPVDDKTSKMKEFIEENYGKSISLKDIADNIHVSSYYACKLFKNRFEINAFEYLNNIRIEKARVYLENLSYKIHEIANLVGITDAHYFSRTFKKSTGYSPREYRELHIKKTQNGG